jgi:hypothetical protein
MSDNLQTALLAALSDAMQPLIEVGGDPAALRALFEDAGWSTDFPEGFPDPALVSAIGELADAVSALVDAVTPPPDSLELLKEAVTKGAAVYRALKKLAPGLTAGGIDPGEVDDLLIQVLDLLIVRYLQVRWPAAYHVARLVGVIEDGVNGTTTPSSTAGTRPRVHFERIPDLVERPAETLRSLYLTAENVNDRVQALSTLVVPVLESLLRSLGVQSVVGLDPGQDLSLSPGAMDAATRTLTAYFPVDPGTAGIALSVGAGAPGVQVTAVPFGNLSLDTQGDTWQATLTAAASTPGVTLDATGVSLPSGHELNLQFILKSVQPDGIVLLGADESTRLQAAGVAVVIEGKFSADTLDFRIAIRLGKAGLAVTSDNGDGFLQSILPSQLGSTFDVEVGYQRSTGVFLGSSPSLEETLPVDYVLGPLTFSTTTPLHRCCR